MGLSFVNSEGEVIIPIDQPSVLMLGPGTVVTHRAVVTLADNNCLLAWTGDEGHRLYASSARVRDELWEKAMTRCGDAAVLQVWSAPNAQGFEYRQHNPKLR